MSLHAVTTVMEIRLVFHTMGVLPKKKEKENGGKVSILRNYTHKTILTATALGQMA